MANPLTKAKDLYNLQKQAREMQQKMKQVLIVGESKYGEVKITMDGTQEVKDIKLEDYILSDKARLVECIKDALKDAQKKMQKEMMKDLDMDKIKTMLGS